MSIQLKDLPFPLQGDVKSLILNNRTTWENFKKLWALISALGSDFIGINTSQSTPQASAQYHIDGYGMAAQGHMHKMTITKDLVIPSDWCNQMVNPVVETGVNVTVEAGGLWFVDA